MRRRFFLVIPWFVVVSGGEGKGADDPPRFRNGLFSVPMRLEIGDVLAPRFEANVNEWLLQAPRANPGMLEMFAVRDRQPRPPLVPWAGEFVGKYLLSAIGMLRLTDDPRLEQTTREIVRRLIESQAEDGYLGPFPKNERLLGHWDLWGHYHCILALMAWFERTGDQSALTACRRAADLACRVYPPGGEGRRVFDAGDHEMNMAISHALILLSTRTRDERYLQLARRIEEDWERAGDYLRTGLAGTEFYRTPRPRWESLHDLQALAAFYTHTTDPRYRTAFLRHWESILRWDRRNTGGFSSGEQATGNPYEPTAIETCCTIAWMAITIDALRLTGDVRAADELELSTYNAMAGAQHPSGRWWTYNTPMDGVREASAHSIVFQARAGTPELNCCSVNGPRGLAMLGDWAVLGDQNTIFVNYLGSMNVWSEPRGGFGKELVLSVLSRHPVGRSILIVPKFPERQERTLAVRVPAWAQNAMVKVPDGAAQRAEAGKYFSVKRVWRPSDAIQLELDFAVRVEAGDRQAFGKASLYRGPLLLAYDQRLNDFDEDSIPRLDARRVREAKVIKSTDPSFPKGPFAPWLVMEVPAADGKVVRVCDYASAGALGTRYRTWLDADNLPPPPPAAFRPPEGAVLPAGPIMFSGRRLLEAEAASRAFTVEIDDDASFASPDVCLQGQPGDRWTLPAEEASKLKPNKDYHWRLIAVNEFGQTPDRGKPKSFRIDPSLPVAKENPRPIGEREDGVIVAADLSGRAEPEYGMLAEKRGAAPAPGVDGRPVGAIALSGPRSLVGFKVEGFPPEDYSAAVWFFAEEIPDRLLEIVSAWCRASDDPLRICLDRGRLFARLEAGAGYSTEPVAVAAGRWHHVALVKRERELLLYLDGERKGVGAAPAEVLSESRQIAVGGNPLFGGDESLAGRFAQFRLFARALSDAEVKALATAAPKAGDGAR